MKIFSAIEQLTECFPSPILTMGNFDGVHLGHQHIFRLVKERAQQLNGTSVALTFDPHPRKVFFPDKEFFLINRMNDKIEIIQKIGISVLICAAFTPQFAAQPPEDFVRDALVNTLHVREVYLGYDSRFGRGKQGTPESLAESGKKFGFTVTIVPRITHDDIIVSSTKIRHLIRHGKVEDAARLLNRPYTLDGIVVSGTRRGTALLGYPTANLETPHELIPESGVYIGKVRWKERTLPAVINIGNNPTFHAASTTVEIHIFDFYDTLYGEYLNVSFLRRLRDEMTFPDHHALSRQIAQDTLAARAYFAEHHSSLC